MSQLIRWGILGTGRIAHKFASDLLLVPGASLVAVGSRTQEAADGFAATYAIPNSHGSYEALAADPEVDVIYISTPHVLHYENTMLCLQQRKAVLCEKPFAMNRQQVTAMIALARQQEVFLMEALWTKFLPHYQQLQELLAAGTIGEVSCVQANFGFRPAGTAPSRLTDPALGGGTLLDIGIYNIFLVLGVLGKPDGITAAITPAANGIDEQCIASFTYSNGAMAQLYSTFSATIPIEAHIFGSKGNIKLTNRFNEPSSRLLLSKDGIHYEELPVAALPGWGYRYEAAHVTACLQQGIKESPVMTWEDSLLLIEMLDKIREITGLQYNK